MANNKISALTAASTPLAGTEVLPIVQSSTTKQVSVANLTAGRAVSMGTAEVTGASTKLSAEVFRTSATSYMRIAGGSAAAAGATILAFGESHGSAPGRLSLNAVGTGYAELGSGDGAYNLRLSSTGDATLSNGNFIQGTAAKGINFTANTPLAGMTSQLLNWYEEGTWTPNQGAGLTLVGAFSSTGRYTRIGRQVSISGTVTGATSVAVTAAGVITSNLPFTVVTAGHGDATNAAVTAAAAVICTSTNVTSASAIAATATITFSATYFV